MKRSFVLIIGVIFLLLSILNSYSADAIVPSFQRSEILSVGSSIVLILTSLLWFKIDPAISSKALLSGTEGLFIKDNLSDELKLELAWGSEMFLTASAASTILIYWNDETLLKRGLISDQTFHPKEICLRSIKTNKMISLVNTKFYPGRKEFDSIIKDLPSIIVYPLENHGVLVLGGWSERCFTKSDERWIAGWSKKLLHSFTSTL